MLKGVVRGKRKPPRIVLYGPPGVGKSTFGADAPSPIFVTTEDGVDALPVDQFPKAMDWRTVLDNLAQVAQGKHEYETVILDTLNGAAELAAQHICAAMYGGQWEAVKGRDGFLSYGRGWKATSEEMRNLIVRLDACRDRGMTVLLLAHVGAQNVRSPIDGEYSKFAPDVDKSVWARFSAWSDIILRADYDYTVVGGDRGRRGVAKGSSLRRLFCRGSAAEDAKCRCGYEIPEEMDLSYDAFAGHMGNGTATLDEVKRLWHLLDDEKAAKALQWAGVSKIEDAPLTKARQILNRLRQIEAERASDENDGAGAGGAITESEVTK